VFTGHTVVMWSLICSLQVLLDAMVTPANAGGGGGGGHGRSKLKILGSLILAIL